MASPGFARESRRDFDDSGFSTNLSASLLEQNSSPQASGPAPSIKALSQVTEGVFACGKRNDPAVPTLDLPPLSDIIEPQATLGESSGPGVDSQATAVTFTIGEEEVNFPTSAQLVGGLRSKPDLLVEKDLIISELQRELNHTTALKDKATQELAECTEKHEAAIASKNAEIKELKNEVEACKLRLSNLEKANNAEKEEYKAKIETLEGKLRHKEEERLKETAVLEKEIAENKLEISKMETKEQKLYCKLAEAKEDAAKAREDAATAKLALAEEKQKRAEESKKIAEDENAKIREENAIMKEELRRSRTDIERLERLNSVNSIGCSGSISDHQLDSQVSLDD